jgi:hypothetical protein
LNSEFRTGKVENFNQTAYDTNDLKPFLHYCTVHELKIFVKKKKLIEIRRTHHTRRKPRKGRYENIRRLSRAPTKYQKLSTFLTRPSLLLPHYYKNDDDDSTAPHSTRTGQAVAYGTKFSSFALSIRVHDEFKRMRKSFSCETTLRT